MVDFNRLRDPAERTRILAKIRADEEAAARKMGELCEILGDCLDHYSALNERERSLLRACQRRIAVRLELSEKQEAWLRDIAGRLARTQASGASPAAGPALG